jgi:hypothetical protein
MTNTDIEYGNQIGTALKDAIAPFGPPAGLYPRVTERERQRNRRRASVRAGALCLAAVATVGGVAWIGQVRTNETPTANQPVQTPLPLTASATVDRIDAYPIINWPGNPTADVSAVSEFHDDDQGWAGTIGSIQPNAAPTSIVAVHTFPLGWNTSLPDTKPGRIAGVDETAVSNGNTTLAWKVGDVPVVVTGDDIDLMYQLVDLIQPIEATPQRGGYEFSGPLPNGLSELETPYHRIAMHAPSLSANDRTFSVAVEQGALLNTLAGGGHTKLDAVTINGLNGYKSTTGNPTIALALSTDETLYIDGHNLTMEQLTDIAKHIAITDETTWRAHYGLTD